MMGEKSKPIRMKENSPQNNPNMNNFNSESTVDVLISRSEIASYAIEGNQA